MKLSQIAARLRQNAIDLETLGAKQGDIELPVEVVVPFVVSLFTDVTMAEKLIDAKVDR